MILDLKLDINKKGDVTDQPSEYNPSDAVKKRTGQVLQDFQLSNVLRNKPYREFNDMSLLNRQSLDQASFNQFVESSSQDPAEAWKSRAFRPIVRNKIITIAAHITASVIFPKIYAQNDYDQEDRDAAVVMRDLMEFVADESDYERTFLKSVIAALVNPASIMYTEYAERTRKIKEVTGVDKDGNLKWEEKEIPDEEFSGFQDQVVPCDEFYISNIYEHDIQKQPFLIWRRVIDYPTARTKYEQYDTFKWVKPGVQFLYSDERTTFYEQYDLALEGRLVEEVIYYNRAGDLQLYFLNGILINDVDAPNPRKDKKYPFSKTGYELFDEGKFFYYKSLPFKTSPDEEVVNTVYRMIIDGTYLNIMPPAVLFGDEEVGSPVIAPGAVTTISSTNPNSSFQTINTNNNLGAGFNILEKVESSIGESTSDILQTGSPLGGQQTAFEISRLEQNARVMLGLFGKMIGFMVKDFGKLRINDILQYMTVGEVMQIENDAGRLKFKNFVLPEKTIDGKTKTRRLIFDQDMPDEMNEESKMAMSEEIFNEEQEFDDSVQIYRINPTLFRNLKFKVSINAEAILPRSEALTKALTLEEYGLAMQNDFIDKEAVTRDLLLGAYEKTRYDPDRYMVKNTPVPMGAPEEQAGLSPSPTGDNSLIMKYLNEHPQ